METDFVVATMPADTADLAVLGTYAGDVLRLILNDFSPGTVPGPQPGKVDFIFLADSAETRHIVQLADARPVLQKGLQGAELYQALFP